MASGGRRDAATLKDTNIPQDDMMQEAIRNNSLMTTTNITQDFGQLCQAINLSKDRLLIV